MEKKKTHRQEISAYMSVSVRTTILYPYIFFSLPFFLSFYLFLEYTHTPMYTQVFTLTKEFGSNATDRISVERNWKVKKKNEMLGCYHKTTRRSHNSKRFGVSLCFSLLSQRQADTLSNTHAYTHSLCLFLCVCACVIYTYTSHDYSYCRILKNFYLLLGAAKELNSKC